MKEGTILIVDDNQDLLRSTKKMLKFDFQHIETINNPLHIKKKMQEYSFDAILLDMNFTEGENSGEEGMRWLKEIIKIDPVAIVIMITAYGEIDIAVKAIKEGAAEFITKPWEPQKLIATLQNAIALRKAKTEVSSLKQKKETVEQDIKRQFDPLIGSSDAMQKVMKTVHKIASTDANVLILGENGTGKELIAREIHALSNRSRETFLSVDLTTLPTTLFESELFGHEEGAFTDAKEDKPGKFEVASKGTLFLDEIGNLSLPLQAKLLTAIQNRSVTRLGSSKETPVDIRLISATNKNLEKLIDEQVFREDLLYRINTITIELPPLRDRQDDIILIAEYYVKKFARHYQKSIPRINAKTCNVLRSHKWPGNIRELKHAVEKAIIMNEDGILNPEDFMHQPTNSQSNKLFTLKIDELEKTAIENAITESKGNISKASILLGISRTSLYSKMKKYGL